MKLLILILSLAFCVCGCRTKVTGGQTRDESRGVFIESRPDGTLTYRDDRAKSSTTQPTIEASDSQAFKIQATGDGMFPALSFEAAKKAAINNWWAMAILVGAGIALIAFMKRIPEGLLLIFAGFLAGVFPIWLLVIGGTLFLLFVYQWWRDHQKDKTLKAGIAHAVKKDPAAAAETLGYLAEKIDTRLQSAIGVTT